MLPADVFNQFVHVMVSQSNLTPAESATLQVSLDFLARTPATATLNEDISHIKSKEPAEKTFVNSEENFEREAIQQPIMIG